MWKSFQRDSCGCYSQLRSKIAKYQERVGYVNLYAQIISWRARPSMAIEAKDIVQCNTNSVQRVKIRVRRISYVCILLLLFTTTRYEHSLHVDSDSSRYVERYLTWRNLDKTYRKLVLIRRVIEHHQRVTVHKLGHGG